MLEDSKPTSVTMQSAVAFYRIALPFLHQELALGHSVTFNEFNEKVAYYPLWLELVRCRHQDRDERS